MWELFACKQRCGHTVPTGENEKALWSRVAYVKRIACRRKENLHDFPGEKNESDGSREGRGRRPRTTLNFSTQSTKLMSSSYRWRKYHTKWLHTFTGTYFCLLHGMSAVNHRVSLSSVKAGAKPSLAPPVNVWCAGLSDFDQKSYTSIFNKMPSVIHQLWMCMT